MEYQQLAPGSPPRVRGTAQALALVGHVLGDHPRACGEQHEGEVLNVIGVGSSPRVRGTGYSVGCVHAWFGIIPARAGNR